MDLSVERTLARACPSRYTQNNGPSRCPSGFRPGWADQRQLHCDRVREPITPEIENTIDSMRAAFELGEDAVELDVHPTTDVQFAVFHDWTLDCRTEGHGETRAHDMAYLKTLDVGYGYSADGGRTFPLRGKGIGLMPSFADVMQAFSWRGVFLAGRSSSTSSPTTQRKARGSRSSFVQTPHGGTLSGAFMVASTQRRRSSRARSG
jgi:glycerophosphoryl diester phosphodiesterase family protein